MGFKSETEIFKNILNTLPNSIYLKDKQGRYLWLNKVSIQQLEYKHEITESIIGKTDLEVFPELNALEYIKNDKKILEENKGIATEEVVILPNGEKLTQLSFKEPLYNDSSKLIGVLGYTLDITDRKKIEKDLHCSKIAAEAANYIMTEFIANMGHDLATPISDVGTIALMLNEYSDEYPELKELFDILLARAEACEKVRKSIINATNISNLDVKPETFSIVKELLMLEKELRADIGLKNLKLIIHPLKSKKEDLIETDQIKFREILSALLSNAINFTVEGQVTVSVLKQEGLFHIKVTDTGIGIPADKYDYIFEQYTKISRSNQHGGNFKGVGAGLYLARLRANILNATISVESKVNKGSTFTFSIPTHPIKTT